VAVIALMVLFFTQRREVRKENLAALSS